MAIPKRIERKLLEKKLKQIDREIAEGKRKVLTEEEVLGEYAHLR